MNILVVLGPLTDSLTLFSRAIVAALPSADSIQIMPMHDVSVKEWLWADWMVLGVTWAIDTDMQALDDFIAALPSTAPQPKALSIFQIQSRRDAPISAAYGFALGRQLRTHDMTLLSPPAVFFGKCEMGFELEGELLRAQEWFAGLAYALHESAHQEP